jgi:hypothetical protein
MCLWVLPRSHWPGRLTWGDHQRGTHHCSLMTHSAPGNSSRHSGSDCAAFVACQWHQLMTRELWPNSLKPLDTHTRSSTPLKQVCMLFCLVAVLCPQTPNDFPLPPAHSVKQASGSLTAQPSHTGWLGVQPCCRMQLAYGRQAAAVMWP